MHFKLSRWKKDWTLMSYIFSAEQIDIIKQKLRQIKLDHLVYCSFENRLAKSGGLGAVTTTILPWLNETKCINQVYLMTPYYPHIVHHHLVPRVIDEKFEKEILERVSAQERQEILSFYQVPASQAQSLAGGCYLLREGLFEPERIQLCDLLVRCGYILEKTGLAFNVLYAGREVLVEILRHRHHYTLPRAGVVEEYYLKAEGFFNARNNIHDPYIYDADNSKNNDKLLLENALFYCCAVPLAMKALGKIENIIFHLQEWQTAMVTLTAKTAMLSGVLESCGTVQSIHNPFDSGISFDLLEKGVAQTGSPIVRQIRHLRHNREFLEQFYDSSLTVFQLALQLMDAPATTVSEYFARELTTDIVQTLHFGPHLQAVFQRNGVLGINNGRFHEFAVDFSQGENMVCEEISAIKEKKRRQLLGVLAGSHLAGSFGRLTYQGKGIEDLPGQIPIIVMSGRLDFNQKGYDILLDVLKRFGKDEIKTILMPMAVKDSTLDIFRQVAQQCDGDILVFPVRMQKEYFDIVQMGATYTVMPSIYEPFGGAIEYIVNGTPPIARETGGLRDQVIHGVNGYLYKEPPGCCDLENIKDFFTAATAVEKRLDNPWFIGMANALHHTLTFAIQVYQNRRDRYHELILKGFEQAVTFDWRASARSYCRIFQKVREV